MKRSHTLRPSAVTLLQTNQGFITVSQGLPLMLVRHSILHSVALLGMTVFLSTSMVFGQGPMMDPNQYYQGGGGQFVAPESYQNPQVLYPPGNPNLEPYPGIDMYRWSQQQTMIDNGIWMQRFLPHEVKHKASMEFILSSFDDPKDVFGYGAGFDSAYYGTGFIDISDYAPRVNGNSTVVVPGTDPLQDVGVGSQIQDLGKAFVNGAPRSGFKLSYGMEFSDGREITVSGFWTQPHTEAFFRGQDPSYFANGLFLADQLSMLNPVLSLNVGDGTATLVPFDEFYHLKWNTQAWGTSFSYLTAPIIERDSYKIRPVMGARFVRVSESIGLKAQDSGTEYTYQLYTGSDSISNPIGGLIQGQRAPGQPIGAPVAFPNLSGISPFVAVPQYRTEIYASADSNLAGPEVGFRLDAGKGKFMTAYIQTNAGLLVNQDKQKLRARGVGNYFLDNDNNGIVDGLDAGNGLRENIIEDRNSHTLISPMYEISTNLELDLFKHLPIIKKFEISENTKLTLGYSYLYVFNIARPYETIDFNAFPNVPKLNSQRGHWSLQTFNLGVTKEF